DVPEISTVVFRRPDGQLETYRIPWTKSGLLLTSVGKYTTPHTSMGETPVVDDDQGPASEPPPFYSRILSRLWNCRIPDRAVNGLGALAPVFAASLPADFTRRLGQAPTDPFYSGVFTANRHNIGFLRIPIYLPANPTAALTAFAREIAYFQENTDG